MKEILKLTLTSWTGVLFLALVTVIVCGTISSMFKQFLTHLNVKRHGWPAPGITIAGEDDPIITFKMPEGAHFTAMAGKEVKIKDHFYPERDGDYELRPKSTMPPNETKI